MVGTMNQGGLKKIDINIKRQKSEMSTIDENELIDSVALSFVENETTNATVTT